MVLFKICPICRMPVTFGGGIITVNASLSPDGLNEPLSSQALYHFCSTEEGSYDVEISFLLIRITLYQIFFILFNFT